jgi:hypothetical protein
VAVRMAVCLYLFFADRARGSHAVTIPFQPWPHRGPRTFFP